MESRISLDIRKCITTNRNSRDKVFKNALSRPDPFKCFKDCLPQILPGPFLNTLSQLYTYWKHLCTHTQTRNKDNTSSIRKTFLPKKIYVDHNFEKTVTF